MGQNLITEFYMKVQTIKQGTLCMGMHYIETLRVSHRLPSKLTARVCRNIIMTLRWSLGIPSVLQLTRQPELTNVNHCSVCFRLLSPEITGLSHHASSHKSFIFNINFCKLGIHQKYKKLNSDLSNK